MENLEIDLSKYKDWLWCLSEDIERLPEYQARSDRVGWVLYLLSRRKIMGRQTAKSQEITLKLEAEQSELAQTVEDAQKSKSWYLGKRGKDYRSTLGISYFIPDWQERLAISQLKTTYFNGYRTDFLKNTKSSALSYKSLSEKKLSEIEYTYDAFYRAGKPIEYNCNEDRRKVIIAFANDLGRSDFESFLAAEIESESGPIADKLEWVASERALGYVMYELASKGYIHPPQNGGEIHYTAFAELVAKVFSGIKSTDSFRQTLSPDGNKRLVETKQKRFRIPDVKEIS